MKKKKSLFESRARGKSARIEEEKPNECWRSG